MKKGQNGFVIIELVIAIAVLIVLVAFSFWFVKHKDTKDSQTTVSQNSKITTPSSDSSAKKEASLSQSSLSQQPGSPQTQSPAAQTTQAQSPSQTQTTQSTSPSSSITKTGSMYEVYRISSDGSSAQETPVTTTLSNVSSVNITIDLQCTGTCSFKLVSDSYSLANTATYASSQKISYTISTPGIYILYNQFTPNTKFKVVF